MSATESGSYESSSDASVSDTEAESDSSLDASMPGPYSFEPSASDTSSATTSESASSSDDDEDSSRLTDMSWCLCGRCSSMPTPRECLCCIEIDKCTAKISDANDSSLKCITEHPGFDAVCLNTWVLQAAYYQYRQEHGQKSSPPSLHEKYRYIAYRQLTRWCWGWLGRTIRVTLPACAVSKIRETFPSNSYKGFQLPSLEF